jgi:hypothetical protein
MYPLEPPAVYIHEAVMQDPRWRPRAEGVVRALSRPVTPVVYRDADLPRLIREQGLLAARQPMGALADLRDPILLFNTFRFDDGFDARRRELEAAGWDPAWNGMLPQFIGAPAFHWANYNLAGDPHRADKVCRPCWRIHLQQGCVHRCLYCGLGGLLVSMVNIEDYIHWLGRLIERHPWQETYLLDDDADPVCLEPEHGVLGPLIEFFGALPDRYLVLHTKTWNTKWLRDLRHNGRTILVWSLSGASQSTLLEPRTGTGEERIEAARIAQEAGYPVRFKFKPIIPVHGWREEAEALVARVLERTRPDILSLCTFMWLDVDEMKRRLPAARLEPAFLAAAEAARETMAGTMTRPFPDEVRAAIYEHYLTQIRRHAPDLPVSLSTESFAMWKRLGRRLGFSATNYVCGCGPQCPPGRRRLAHHPFRSAVRADAGAIPGVF